MRLRFLSSPPRTYQFVNSIYEFRNPNEYIHNPGVDIYNEILKHLEYLNAFFFIISFPSWSICCERWLTHSLSDWKPNKSMCVFFFKPRRLTRRSFYNIYLSLALQWIALITSSNVYQPRTRKFFSLWLTFMRSLFLVGCYLSVSSAAKMKSSVTRRVF